MALLVYLQPDAMDTSACLLSTSIFAPSRQRDELAASG